MERPELTALNPQGRVEKDPLRSSQEMKKTQLPLLLL